MPTERAGLREIPLSGLWLFPSMRNAIAAGFLLAAGFFTGLLTDVPDQALLLLFLPAIVLGASHWGREALESIREFRINIDVLMGAATLGAAALGLWEEAAFLAFLYGAAEALEEFAYERTTGAIQALLELAPKEAKVLKDGTESLIAATDLKNGDRFIVRPGESVPTDGNVESGFTTIDESSITGESNPIEKIPGDLVFGGTINTTGAIVVVSTSDFEVNTISRIVDLVKKAQEQKSNVQRRIDSFGNWYSPTVLAAALLLGLVPSLFGGDVALWTERAITLAVAGAPCALVMSTPVAVAAAIGKTGKRGVLIKGGAYLEQLSSIDTLAFDKTGTLTSGKPSVTDIVPLNNTTVDVVISMAASVERYSEHPTAKAIVECRTNRGLAVSDVTNFTAIPGRGVTALLDDSFACVGNLNLLSERGFDTAEAAKIVLTMEERGDTAVLVAGGGKLVGVIALNDAIRPEVREGLMAIRRSGVRKLVIVSGDNQKAAERVGREVGINDVYAALSPQDKLDLIGKLQSGGHRVAMIGDGINDAPALAAADVGIAMGVAGTDVAIETADMALMGDDIRGVAFAIDRSRLVARISRQNLVFSSVLLAVLLPLAAIGSIGIAVAVLVHEASELIAVGNGLRVWKD